MFREIRFTVTDATAQRIEDIAQSKGIEVSELLRQALAQYAMIDELIESDALLIDTSMLPPSEL